MSTAWFTSPSSASASAQAPPPKAHLAGEVGRGVRRPSLAEGQVPADAFEQPVAPRVAARDRGLQVMPGTDSCSSTGRSSIRAGGRVKSRGLSVTRARRPLAVASR
jgi:hypothetical protein